MKIERGIINIYIDNIKIDTVNKIKMLSLLINNTLNWSAYIKSICNKISKNSGIIKKEKNKLEKRLVKSILYVYLPIYYLR